MLSILGGCLIGGACRAWATEHATALKVVAAVIKLKLKGSHY